MQETPLISISCATYNRGKFIAQAIDSWLSQETSFTYEIIITDNASEDNTQEIVQAYQKKHPGLIHYVRNDQNHGMMFNFIQGLKLCKGKYIAVCDADDYWITNDRLQKQVEFLEENPDFSACYSNSYVLVEETGEQAIAKKQLWDIADSEDLLDHDDFKGELLPLSPGHISALIFRNHLLPEYPKWFYDCGLTDFPLYMMLSKYGKAKFFNECTTVYRTHQQGWSTENYQFETVYLDRVRVYKEVNRYLDFKYAKKINGLIAKHYLNLGKNALKRKQYWKGCKFLIMGYSTNWNR